MLAASTASKKGSSSDGGIMRLRKPVCRTAHATSSRMAPCWWQPYPDVPKEAMRSNSAAWATRRRPNAPVIHLGERILFNQLDAASGMWTLAIPTARTVMTPHELREVAAGYFFLPSPCLASVVGIHIILPSTEQNPVTVDLYCDALINLPAPVDAHWRVRHDRIADAFCDHCVHDMGIDVRREVDDLFQQAVPLGNTVPRNELKDLVPDAELSLPAFSILTGSYDTRSLKPTLREFKTMRRYGVKYTAVPRATAADRFERSLLGDVHGGWQREMRHGTTRSPDRRALFRNILDMSEYTGMVFGTVDSSAIPLPKLHSTSEDHPHTHVHAWPGL
eukprot:jgi/Tetstr1/426910/TSEL_017123.t1